MVLLKPYIFVKGLVEVKIKCRFTLMEVDFVKDKPLNKQENIVLKKHLDGAVKLLNH
jgi:hypothetical protein